MRLSKLFIKNFICYDESTIDFSSFKSALIVGKRADNDMFANGVGKTTIFKAIEFVLFNHVDDKFERVIRDDTDKCQVILDFIEDNEEYRIVRQRTKKGSADVSLYKRNSVDPDNLTYQFPINSKYWIDLTGRRSSDTEKEISKIIRFNLKSFRNTVHFVQKDITGLATTTPEKRKAILKDALNLSIYQKLEKIAKEHTSSLNKDIEKNQLLISSLVENFKDIDKINLEINSIKELISIKEKDIKNIDFDVENQQLKFNSINDTYTKYNDVYNSLYTKKQLISSEIDKINKFIAEYKNKRTSSAKMAKSLIDEIKQIKDESLELSKIDFSLINSLDEQTLDMKNRISVENANIKINKDKIVDLEIPMPKDAVCKHCRQQLTEEHRKVCQEQIKEEILQCKLNIQKSKNILDSYSEEVNRLQLLINNLKINQKKFETIHLTLQAKNKEVLDKQNIYNEYGEFISKFEKDLSEKSKDILNIENDLLSFNTKEFELIKQELLTVKNSISDLNKSKSIITKDIISLSNNKAVLEHSIVLDKQNKDKKEKLSKDLDSLYHKYKIYDPVLKAFSSTGIPNIIIQNMLDSLQNEANEILSKLRPDIQISFVVEKTKGDGTQDDTLEIIYYVGGRERTFNLLSGAMQMLVHFSLKLGLSFLLQKMMGTNIEFLLFDEIDPDLDKATVDAFSDIVKLFQKDFNIMVITHNDRLKDKFSQAILVEQDVNMVSKAKVVSEW